MNRFLRIINTTVPYIAVEMLQYFLLSVIIYIQNYTAISEDLLYILSAGIIAVSGIVFFFWYHYEISGEVRGRIHNLFTVKYISLFILLGIGCQLFFTGIMTLIKPFFTEVFSEYSEVLENLTAGNQIIVLLLMIVIAPVSEELIFRGVILHRANKIFSFMYANILQALFFGLYHGNIVQGIYAALIGFLLGAAYYKFRTIYASILLHVIINASSLLMILIPDRLMSYIIIILSGGAFMVISLLLIDLRKVSGDF
jgi:membrane protease YdiL (CAAX protease family)